jgi:aspartyl-tRNA(Asn)/glutamyl-tRNA(Gln) amidotransferase subunit C
MRSSPRGKGAFPFCRSADIFINLGLPVYLSFATLCPMAVNEIDVKYVAHLARIALTPAEEEKIGAQLGQVLGYIEKLKELDVDGIEPTAHAVPLVNISRSDVIQPSLPHAEAMRNAPAQANGLFTVPKIVE